MTWTKETALAELAELERQIDEVKESGCLSAPHVRWRSRALEFLKDVFEIPSPYYQTLGKLTWTPRGSRILSDIETAREEMDEWRDEEFRRQMEVARGTLQAAQDELRRKNLAAVQRRPPEGTKGRFEGAMADPDPKKVFVIHGRNHRARDAVKELLRAAGLQPLEWGQARALTKKPNAFIWDIVEAGFGACATAVVLMTGDEIVQVRPEFVETRDRAEDKEPAPQSRPNVLIEMGAALARGRYSVVIAQVGEHRRISDIEGMHICHLRTDAEARQDLIDRLKDAGATPDDTAREHLSAGNFDAAVVPFRAPAAKSASEGPDPCPPGSDEERILALLYKAGQRPLSRLQLANKLSLEPGPLDVALDELKDGELIDAQYSITMEDEEPNPNYYITPKGRKLARQREL